MGRLGIIAASGTLPLELANRAKLQGENPFIICLEGQADQDYSPCLLYTSPSPRDS